MNIYLAWCLLVAVFAAGWAMGKRQQRCITREQERARVKGLRIPEPFRYALSTTEGKQACMEWGVKHSSATTESPKSNLLPRYEPS